MNFVTNVLVETDKILPVILQRVHIGDVFRTIGRIGREFGIYVREKRFCVLTNAGGIDLASGGSVGDTTSGR